MSLSSVDSVPTGGVASEPRHETNNATFNAELRQLQQHPPRASLLPLQSESPADVRRFFALLDAYFRLHGTTDATQKLDILLLHLTPRAQDLLLAADLPPPVPPATVFTQSVAYLRDCLLGSVNVMSARLQFYNCRQTGDMSTSSFVALLRQRASDAAFGSFEPEALRDVFVLGLASESSRRACCRAYASLASQQRTFSLDDAIRVVAIEEEAMKTAAPSSASPTVIAATVTPQSHRRDGVAAAHSSRGPSLAATAPAKCGFCGRDSHPRSACPARDAQCRRCRKQGHWEVVCRQSSSRQQNSRQQSSRRQSHGQAGHSPRSSKLSSLTSLGSRFFVDLSVNGCTQTFLCDTGSDLCIVSASVATRLSLNVIPHSHKATSVSGHTVAIRGISYPTVSVANHSFPLELFVSDVLVDDAVVGMPFFAKFHSVRFFTSGDLPVLDVRAPRVSALQLDGFADVFSDDIATPVKTSPVRLLENVVDTPVRSASRRRSPSDLAFIKDQLDSWRSSGIVRESRSAWRSQLVVVRDDAGRPKRLAVDYSTTVNPLTPPDAFPLPLVDECLDAVGKFRYFSVLDARSAYLQLPLHRDEWRYTAFEAAGRLWEFTRVPFGLKNGVAAFQRFIATETADMPGVIAYLDDIVVGGETESQHDQNFVRFMRFCREVGLKLSASKSTLKARKICFLGCEFDGESGLRRPDPTRIAPLTRFPVPKTLKELERFLGLANYYARWVPRYADVAAPLFELKNAPPTPFAFSQSAHSAMQSIISAVQEAAVAGFRGTGRLVLETDASTTAVGGILSEDDRPIAFISRRLTPAERKWSPVEWEAYALVVCVEKLRHYLSGRHFTVVTDQRGVSFLFDAHRSRGVKNSKIGRWRLELAEYDFNTLFRPGRLNMAADVLSRVSTLSASTRALSDQARQDILQLHADLGHPGSRRLFVHLRAHAGVSPPERLIADVLRNCELCCRVKPRFEHLPYAELISADRPWQRLSLDFVGPLPPGPSGERFLLNIVDEYSRYPFAVPTERPTAAMVCETLSIIFNIFGPPEWVHSDRGSQFESAEFKRFLDTHGVGRSRSTPYNPRANGQIERLNGEIWKTIQLVLAGRDISHWPEAVHPALNCLRTLPSRAIGDYSPHDRLFRFGRRTQLSPAPEPMTDSTANSSLPSWIRPGARALFRNPRRAKGEPKGFDCEVVESLSPYVVKVRHADGRCDTVSTRHLARLPDYTAVSRQDSALATAPTVEHPAASSAHATSQADCGPPLIVPVPLPPADPVSTDGDADATIPYAEDPPVRPVRSRVPPTHLEDYLP